MLAFALASRVAAAAAPLDVAETYFDRIGPVLANYSAAGWAFRADARRVYIKGDGDAAELVALFERDVQTGTLRYVSAAANTTFPAQFGAGRILLLGPGERDLYTDTSYHIAVLRADQETGVPALAQVTPDIVQRHSAMGVEALVVPPDGRHVYVGTRGAMVMYPRSSDGLLAPATFLPIERATPLVFWSLAVTADGRFLYAGGYDSPGNTDLLVFARDVGNGTLHLIQRVGDGVQGRIVGDAYAVAMSDDERQLYLANGQDPDSEVTVLARDANTGLLDLVQAVPHDPGGLGCATRIAASPDGTLIYTSCGDRLTVYHRTRATGRIAIVQLLRDGEGGVESIDGADAIQPSPDGRHVYVLASQDHAVTVFRHTCGDGVLDVGETCDDGNLTDGDGCDAACRIEPCFTCAGEPSACVPADGEHCDDGQPCTRDDVCSGGACVGTRVADGEPCDDGNACTVGDTCAGGKCTPHATLTCGPCEACDTARGCVGILHSGCLRSPVEGAHGRLSLERRSGGRVAVDWQWLGDRWTKTAQLGNPLGATGYRFCVFDDREGSNGFGRQRHVVLGASVPAAAKCGHRACWHRRPNGDFFFRDETHRGAIHSIVLTRARAGLPAVAVAGTGRAAAGSLPMKLPTTVQLSVDGVGCWQADLAIFVQHNDRGHFVGRAGLERSCPSCGPGE